MPDVAPRRRALCRTRFGQIHVEETGEGAPLVLLHMSPLSTRMFDSAVPRLSLTRRVLCIDRIGFGSSDPITRPMTVGDHVEAALEALIGAGIDRFDVVGIHTGSMEAIEMAITSPDRVRTATVVGLVVLTPKEADRFRASIHAPAPRRDGGHLHWYWAYWDAVRMISSHLEEWQPPLTHARVFDHVASWPNAKATYDAVFDHATENRLSKVERPLLVLCPKDEFWEISHRSMDSLPRTARFTTLPDTDYEAFTFSADVLVEEIVSFISDPRHDTQGES